MLPVSESVRKKFNFFNSSPMITKLTEVLNSSLSSITAGCLTRLSFDILIMKGFLDKELYKHSNYMKMAHQTKCIIIVGAL